MVHIKNKKPIVYGICGEKFHGKDFFASLIKGRNNNFVILHFADELKRICSTVFGIPKEYFTDSNLKEKQINPIDIDQRISLVEAEVGFKLPRLNKVANSARELMQLIGTEYVRSVKDNYWVSFIKRKIENSNNKGRFIVADVRFTNEETMIKEFGKLIQVKRIDLLSKNKDNHASEAIDLLKPDLVIGSLTDKLIIPQKVAYLLSTNKWEAAVKYDYRKLRLAIESYSKTNSLEKVAKNVFDTTDTNVVKNMFSYYSVHLP